MIYHVFLRASLFSIGLLAHQNYSRVKTGLVCWQNFNSNPEGSMDYMFMKPEEDIKNKLCRTWMEVCKNVTVLVAAVVLLLSQSTLDKSTVLLF